ncbi:MAG: hypothetical protein AAGG51_16965 [Cyanobacteria bacterium P01_G01_bin.54]
MAKPGGSRQLRDWAKACTAGLMAALSLGFARPAAALPGQSTEVVSAWILGNATLQSRLGEDLIVQRSSGSQSFKFEASIFAPGRRSGVNARGLCRTPIDRGRIRSEQFVLEDFNRGVPLDRLELGLRSIYGLEIYLDYRNSGLVYAYPNGITLDQARRQSQLGFERNYGEIRIGEYYAYWLEQGRMSNGFAPSGQVTVLLKEDVPKLVLELGGGEIGAIDCPSSG